MGSVNVQISNYSSPLETIQVILLSTYLQRLGDYFHGQGQLAEESKNNSLLIANSLIQYLYPHPSYKSNVRLVRRLLKGSDLYGENNGDYLDKEYIDLMFQYLIHSFAFNEYVDVYGFLAEILRSSDSPKIDVLLETAKEKLQNMTTGEMKEYDFVSNAPNIIFQDIIEPLFPKSIRNLSINSVDLIYAQAGWHFYNSDLVQNISRLFVIEEEGDTYDSLEKYVFEDCVEIALAIQHLVILNQIDKSALEIFALPALLYYVYTEKESLRGENISIIISDPNHWTKAYSLLFSHLNHSFDEVTKSLNLDPKYQYYLALYNLDREMIAREALINNCSLRNGSLLEREIPKYMNNSDYECPDEHQKLTSLSRLFEEKIDSTLSSNHLFVLELFFENTNYSKFKNRLLKINGELFEACDEFPYNYTSYLVQVKVLWRNLTQNGSFEEYYRIPTNSTKQVHCLSLLFSCVAGVLDGNPINSSNTCPIHKPFRLQDVLKRETYGQFTTNSTRSLLSELGTSLKTIALRASMLTALTNRKYVSSKEKLELKSKSVAEDMVKDLGFPKFQAIDRGYKLGKTLGEKGLRSLRNLLNVISDKFFIQYESESRIFKVTSQMNHELVSHLDQWLEKKQLFIKNFHGKINIDSDILKGYGYKFAYLENGQIAECRTVFDKTDGKGKFHLVVPTKKTLENEQLYRTIFCQLNYTNNKCTDLHQTEKGLEVYITTYNASILM